MTDRPRLLFCCFSVVPGPSATAHRLTAYLKGLSRHFEVVVLSVKTPALGHIETYHEARLLRVPVGTDDFASRAQAFDRAVRRQLESEEYAIVHFFDPFGGFVLCDLRADHEHRLVYDACTFPSVELPLTHPDLAANRSLIASLRRQELLCLMNADAVIVGSPLTADYVASLGVSREALHVLRAPVDLDLPSQVLEPDPTGALRVLHLGQLAPGNGVETLFEATQIATKRANLRLLLVPKNAEDQASVEGKISHFKLEDRVDFAPLTSELGLPLAKADIGVLTLDPVHRNQVVGMPLGSLGECLASGRLVVAADLPAARTLLPDNGVVLYRPGDAHSLAEALIELALDPERRRTLGLAARDAGPDWDARAVRQQLLALHQSLAPNASADAPRHGPSDATPLLMRQDNEITELGPAAVVPITKEVAAPTPISPAQPGFQADVAPPDEDIAEIDAGEVLEVDGDGADDIPEEDSAVLAVEHNPSPPPSALDPWLAQLVHGYCPPNSTLFDRPPPPTTMPGKKDTAL